MLTAVKTGLRQAPVHLDTYQRRHAWLGFPLAVAKKFSQDRAGGQASLIAYYGFFALFPLLLVFATVLGFVLHGNTELQTRVLDAAKSQFPSLSDYLRVGSVSGSGLALGLGIATSLWAGLGVTNAAQTAFNSVWDVPMVERPNLWRSRLRGIGLLATLGTTIVISSAAAGLRGVGGPLAGVFDVVGVVAPLLLNLVLYLVAFQVLTSLHLTWQEVLPGSVLGAVAWTALQSVGGYFVRNQIAHASHLYGTFALVIGLLAWIHLGAQVTLYCAEVNVVRARHLWPRALVGSDFTEADHRAFLREVREADRRPEDEIPASEMPVPPDQPPPGPAGDQPPPGPAGDQPPPGPAGDQPPPDHPRSDRPGAEPPHGGPRRQPGHSDGQGHQERRR